MGMAGSTLHQSIHMFLQSINPTVCHSYSCSARLLLMLRVLLRRLKRRRLSVDSVELLVYQAGTPGQRYPHSGDPCMHNTHAVFTANPFVVLACCPSGILLYCQSWAGPWRAACLSAGMHAAPDQSPCFPRNVITVSS